MHSIKIILFTFFIALSAQVFPQAGSMVSFEELTHDFGTFKEEDGIVSFDFVFTNISNKPINIIKVETSCGCTTPKYSTDTVFPGKSGKLKALYDPSGKLGAFTKHIYVYFNRPDFFQTLIIKGNVIPRPQKVFKEQAKYSVNYDNLAFSRNTVQFNTILNSESKEETISVYNYNGYPIKIFEINELPEFSTVELSDSTIRPSDSISIKIKIDGSKITTAGDIIRRIGLLTDDEAKPQKFVYLLCYAKMDFSKLSKRELKKAPKIKVLNNLPYEYGKRTAGGFIHDTLTIVNNGKTELKIRRVKPSCSCLTYSIPKYSLAPGERMTIKLKFDLINQPSGNLRKYLTLYTNDPKASEINIPFNMTVSQ